MYVFRERRMSRMSIDGKSSAMLMPQDLLVDRLRSQHGESMYDTCMHICNMRDILIYLSIYVYAAYILYTISYIRAYIHIHIVLITSHLCMSKQRQRLHWSKPNALTSSVVFMRRRSEVSHIGGEQVDRLYALWWLTRVAHRRRC